VIKLRKIAGNQFKFSLMDGAKAIQWIVDGDDVDVSTLLDVINAENPHTPPTAPHYAIGYRPKGANVRPEVIAAYHGEQWPIPGLENLGAQAADRAAKDEEMRLRNMGAALAKGINLGPEDIPVFNGEAGDALPPVNWGA
jgi:hypothetical protein